MTSSPRWKVLIDKSLAENPTENVFSLASIETHGNQLRPRVRSHIFRDFMIADSKPEFPMLLTSTDIRAPKVSQFLQHDVVEQVWWIEGSKHQFRISSHVYVLPDPRHELHGQFMERMTRVGVTCGMSGMKNLDRGEWEEKRVGLFKTMPSGLKATWARAEVPGSELSGNGKESEDWPPGVDERDDRGSADDNWHRALANFGMVILDPDFVDV
ncbi:hypothetical protein CVT24_005461, partial [Panaeolus cyanescens]